MAVNYRRTVRLTNFHCDDEYSAKTSYSSQPANLHYDNDHSTKRSPSPQPSTHSGKQPKKEDKYSADHNDTLGSTQLQTAPQRTGGSLPLQDHNANQPPTPSLQDPRQDSKDLESGSQNSGGPPNSSVFSWFWRLIRRQTKSADQLVGPKKPQGQETEVTRFPSDPLEVWKMLEELDLEETVQRRLGAKDTEGLSDEELLKKQENEQERRKEKRKELVEHYRNLMKRQSKQKSVTG